MGRNPENTPVEIIGKQAKIGGIVQAVVEYSSAYGLRDQMCEQALL